MTYIVIRIHLKVRSANRLFLKTTVFMRIMVNKIYTTGLMTSSFLRVRIRRICEKGDLPDEAIVLSRKTDVHL